MRKFYVLFLAVTFISFGVTAQKASMTEREKEAYAKQQYEISLMEDFQKVSNEPMVQYGQTGNKGPFDNFVEIGNGVDAGSWPAYYGPWANYWTDAHTQTLYLASELTGVETITGLQWDFFDLPNSDQELNVEIRILTTSDAVLTLGDYYDMAGSVTVFSTSNYIPATANGWGDLIDITDFSYNGTDNLIIDVLLNGSPYTSPYYKNNKTDGGVTRMLIGYADNETPPDFDAGTNYFSNIRFYYEAAAPPPPPTIPLSNWAFALIGLFAVTLVFFKFRK